MKEITQIAKVELISIHYLDVFKWLRKEFNLSIIEAKNISKNGTIIDFNGNIEKAISLYNYINRQNTSSARLIIDHSFDTRGYTGATGALIDENNKYHEEYTGLEHLS